jgi:hypothetical protein
VTGNGRSFLARVREWLRGVRVWLDPPYEPFQQCSFREFLADGAQIVAGMGIESDAHPIAQAMLSTILAHDATVDLDASTIEWYDQSYWVELGRENDHITPSELGFSVVGDSDYEIGFNGYPPTLSVGGRDGALRVLDDLSDGQPATISAALTEALSQRYVGAAATNPLRARPGPSS